jgi:RNA polymerase sigma-70 factor (ECF subfamily)
MERRTDDTALVRRARQGDLDAFEALVERHGPVVYRLALRLLGDADDACDATQDVFLRVWRSLGNFREGSAFTTWVHRVTTNRCLNELRRRPRSAPLPDVIVTSEPGPERIAEARQQIADLARAMTELTPEQRVVLVLREFEHCSHEEIAEVLDISVSSIKGRLHRARMTLVIAMRAWR